MPIKMWKPKCTDCEGKRFALTGTPVCGTCGTPGEYDGWHFGMHEMMAQYQSRFGLKPIGLHRKLADELFSKVTVKCHVCDGKGIRNLNGGESYEICGICRGLGSLFAGPLTELIEIRRRILEAFPDAAAASVPEFATHPIAHNLAKGTMEDLQAEGGSDDANRKESI
jgi:RecJ-like exonuclease